MRCILIILDGLGDRSHESLDGRTPLQSAFTPHLDYLATIGMNGLYHSFLQGVPMSSEIAHFLLFGYELSDFAGRGYLEALGYDISIRERDVVLISHFCSVKSEKQKLILVKRRPDIDKHELKILKEIITPYKFPDIDIKFVSAEKTNGFLILSGQVSPAVTDSDPFYEGRPLIAIQPTDSTFESKRTAIALNQYIRWTYNKLSEHSLNLERQKYGLFPVNILVTQRAGRKKFILPFSEKWGLKAISISSAPIYWGLGKELGIELVKLTDSDDPEKDLVERLDLAWKAKEYDFIHVHTKMPDKAGHRKDPTYKKEIIESLDCAFRFILEKIKTDPDILLVITADHSTASSGTMIHTGETVPLTIVGKNIRRDKVNAFNEIDCAHGALGLVKGKELMCLILNFLDRAKLKGLMDTPIDQPYYPGNYKPLRLNDE